MTKLALPVVLEVVNLSREILKRKKNACQRQSPYFAELKAATKNLEAMKKQAESTNTEYDRLMKEHSQLQVS